MRILYFDAHCDTIQFCKPNSAVDSEKLYGFKGHISLERLKNFYPCGQFFALFGGSDNSPEHQQSEFLRQYNAFKAEMHQNSDCITHCVNSAEMISSLKQGKICAFLSVEGAEMLGCCIDGLDAAYTLGVRSVMPVWNHSNILCGSCAENSELGLSEQGIEFVSHAYKKGILIDVSHMSDKGFYDVYSIARRFNMPVIASHSNSRSVCNNKRNLTDDMFQKIIQTGGFAGINLYSDFVSQSNECRISDITAHIDRFISLGGADNICLGCDFDGCDKLPIGISSVSDIEKLYYSMVLQGYPSKIINKIFGKNLIRIICSAL